MTVQIELTYEEACIAIEAIEDAIARATNDEHRTKLIHIHSKIHGQSLRTEEAINATK